MADDYMFGLALGNGRRANAATAAAFAGAQGLHEAAAHLGALKDEVATLKRQAQIDEAAIEGHVAQINALKATHPASPLLADSGKRFKDGDPKSKLRLVFEQTFDAALRKIGITSPGSFRVD
jgi:hypothetical protein